MSPGPPQAVGSVPETRSATRALAAIDAAGLLRRMRLIEGAQGSRVRIDGREVLLLCSNNYLGLAEDPRVRSAGARAFEQLGAGAGASRLVSGNMSVHERLERRLAEFHGYESALLFGSGYLANTGTIAALAPRGSVVYSDELNHASIVDGCRLARAETFVYRHRDLEHLEWAISRAAAPASLLVSDGLFSMDGDFAPVERLLAVARRAGARLMIDDAHALGTTGPGGRGSVAAASLAGEVDLISATLGKSLGSYGAYICASRELRDLLVNTARPAIFSTGLPPAGVAAAEAALSVLEDEPGLVDRLASNAAVLREALLAEGLALEPGSSQIIPVGIGAAERATAASERALSEGVFAQAIRPPTVPEGTSRLRLTVMASHEPDELRAAAAVIAAAITGAGRRTARPQLTVARTDRLHAA